jgi:Helix-turn-helix domain
MERDFKGIWIPKEIWLNNDLTLQEKVFLVEIDSLDNKEGCYASNQYFADFFGISTTRVSLIIKSLCDKGYIKSTLIYKEGTKQILKRVLNICYRGYLRNVKEGYLTFIKDPPQGKLKDNNTINNTNKNNTINNIKKEKKKSEFDLLIDDYTNDLQLRNTIYEFIKMRKAIKAAMTSNALKLMLSKLDKLSNGDKDKKFKILEQSIMNSWKGIFELKETINSNKKSNFGNSMKELYEEARAFDEQNGTSSNTNYTW